MKAEDLFDATEQLPAKKAIVKIIDLKIDNDMREAITKMEALFAATNARVDAVEKHVGGLEKRMDRMDNTMRWGFGIIITLMLAMKFFK